MIIPPKLKSDDLVAIIAPASASNKPDALNQAVLNIESLGLKAKVMPNAGSRWGYFAGTDEQRAEDFNRAVADPEVKAIICLRGGYGTMRILPMICYEEFQRNPKIVMGYSDITGLLNALTRMTGVVTYHGPIAESKFLGYEGEWARKALLEPGPLGVFAPPITVSGRSVEPAPRTINGGKAKGRLIGGNLCLISPVIGSPYQPDFKGSILFLEDIQEHPYRVDRMLTGLWLSGCLDQLNGIVFGDFVPHPEEKAYSGPKDETFTMDQVFDNLRLWTQIPIFTGLYAGHIKDKVTLPIGGVVEMDADALTLTDIIP